ncbi:MAG: PepSY domain-containing protein [Nitrospirota bacterium]
MALCTALPLRRWLLSGLALCMLGAFPLLRADERNHGDHAMALQALEQGRVLPLRTVLEKVERDYQGQALKVEFEQDDGRFIYEIRLLQSDGRMAKLKVDAVDGRVLDIRRKERGGDRDAHPRR